MNDTAKSLLSRYSSKRHAFVEPVYLTVYNFEKNYNFYAWHGFLNNYWLLLTVCVSALYFSIMYLSLNWMRNRKPFRLTRTLVVWNSSLALFSLTVVMRVLPEFLRVVRSKNGLHNSICNWTEPHNYATVFWSSQFVISKSIELFDTFFIILRKRDLTFLHCYHHAMTFVITLVSAVDYEPNHLWYVVMNSFIHSFMYSYYAIRAAGLKVPRSCAMTITTMQIVQMVIAILVNIYGFNMWFQGKESECPRSYFGFKICLAVGFSYLVLFLQFYYKTYILPRTMSSMSKNNSLSMKDNNRNSNPTKKLN